MAVRDNRRGTFKEHKIFSQEITHKEFGADDNEGHDAMLWKNRERDWYNAERRFIFATKTLKKRNKWIKEITKDKVSSGLHRGIVEIIETSRPFRQNNIANSVSPASGSPPFQHY